MTQAKRDMAMENQTWVLWRFDGSSDVEAGESPVGEKLGRVYGFRAAAETARMYMSEDPTCLFMKLVPTMPNTWMKIGDTYVRRRNMVGAGRPQLDPEAGRMFPKATNA